jgi:hypothetical protein
MAQVSFHVGKECLARQVTNVSSELTKWSTKDWEQHHQQQRQRFLSIDGVLWSKVAADVHIFAYYSPGVRPVSQRRSRLTRTCLGIDFDSQPVVLPAESHHTQSSLRRVVVDLAVVKQPGEISLVATRRSFASVREPSRGRVHSTGVQYSIAFSAAMRLAEVKGQSAKTPRKLRSAAARFKPSY